MHAKSGTEAPPINGRRPQANIDDLDRLLVLAEWLVEKREGSRTRLTWLLHYATGLGGAVISAAVLVWTFMEPESTLRMPLTGTILGSAGAVASVSLMYWLHLRRIRAADQRALDAATELLRDAAIEVEARENLPAMTQATLRIRLTRLATVLPGSQGAKFIRQGLAGSAGLASGGGFRH